MQSEAATAASVQSTLEEFVRAALIDSLKSVRKRLKTAAKKWTKDDEFVHQLRVSGRRALSALNLFEVLLPTSDACWLRKRLKSVLQAAGRARDLDVLIKTQVPRCGKAQKTLEKRWWAERIKAQRPLVTLQRKLKQNGQFRKHVQLLVRNLKPAAPSVQDAKSVCDQRILPQFSGLCRSVLNALAVDVNARSSHELRIAVKRLRYAAELLLPVSKGSQMHDMNEALNELQKQLGEMQDHVVAKQELKRMIERLGKKSGRERLEELIIIETRSIADSIETLRQWLESDACRQLKCCLESIV